MRREHIELVIRKTAEFFSVKPAEILGECREQEFCRPRFLAIYLARELTGLSYLKLGDVFDRDHTVILRAVRKIDGELVGRDGARLAAILDLLRDRIGEDLEAAAGEGQVQLA